MIHLLFRFTRSPPHPYQFSAMFTGGKIFRYIEEMFREYCYRLLAVNLGVYMMRCWIKQGCVVNDDALLLRGPAGVLSDLSL